jgi:hypothetical protein
MRVECPYVGLVPFTEESARFFFGREADQAVLIANLFAARVTIVYGASGVGKSSLLRAGVVKELHRRTAEARQRGDEPELRVVYFKEWQERPLLRLQQQIRASAGLPPGSGDGDRLVDVLARTLDRFAGDVMVLLDQFEDYFKYPDAGPRSFGAELVEALQRHDLPVSFLLSLRDDALSRLDRFQRLVPNLLANALRVEPLRGEQAEQAIRRPLEVYNALPPEEQAHAGPFTIEDGLVGVVLEQVRRGEIRIGDTGRGRARGASVTAVEAPYLQLVMTRVWAAEAAAGSRVLRATTFGRLGGAQRIVQSHLDGVMNTLSVRQRLLSARLFEQLVTPSGNKIAHTASDLSQFARAGEDEVLRLLTTLSGSEARIVTPVAPPAGHAGASHFEIYHDALAPAVLDWRRRYRLKWRVREWVTVAAVVGTLLGGWALYQARIAREAAEYAERANRAQAAEAEARKRARLAEDTARMEAQKAREAEERIARLAQAHFEAEGKLTEAARFREMAQQAARQKDDLEARIGQDANALALAQTRLSQFQNMANEARRDAEAARQEAKRAREDLAPKRMRIQVSLPVIRVVQEGSERRWSFGVSAGDHEWLFLRPAAYSDRNPASRRSDRDTSFDYLDATPLEIGVVGKGDSSVTAVGKQTVHLPNQSEWTQPLRVKLPVFVESDPRRGTFIFEFEIQPQPRAPAARK